MHDVNLLDYFALARTQTVKLAAELKQSIAADRPLQAKVEVKLTPTVDIEKSLYQMALSLQADVQDDGTSVFVVELAINALYHPLGEGADGTLFSQYHTTLGRQLYPLAHAQIQGVLAQFGLHQVRLPGEIIHRNAKSENVDPAKVH